MPSEKVEQRINLPEPGEEPVTTAAYSISSESGRPSPVQRISFESYAHSDGTISPSASINFDSDNAAFRTVLEVLTSNGYEVKNTSIGSNYRLEVGTQNGVRISQNDFLNITTTLGDQGVISTDIAAEIKLKEMERLNISAADAGMVNFSETNLRAENPAGYQGMHDNAGRYLETHITAPGSQVTRLAEEGQFANVRGQDGSFHYTIVETRTGHEASIAKALNGSGIKAEVRIDEIYSLNVAPRDVERMGILLGEKNIGFTAPKPTTGSSETIIRFENPEALADAEAILEKSNIRVSGVTSENFRRVVADAPSDAVAMALGEKGLVPPAIAKEIAAKAEFLHPGQTAMQRPAPTIDSNPSSTFQKQPQQQQQQRHQPTAQQQQQQEQWLKEQQARQSKMVSDLEAPGGNSTRSSIVQQQQQSRHEPTTAASGQGKVLEMPEGPQLKQGTIRLSTGGAEPIPKTELKTPPKLGPQLVQKAPTGPTASPKSNLIEMPGHKTAPKIPGAPPHEVPAGASRVTHLAEAPHDVNTAARLTTAERGVGGLSRGMEIGGAFAPLALGGLAGGVGAAMDGKSGKEIAVATGKGAIEGGFGVSDAKVALDKHQRLADRLLAGGRSATATTATVAGVASLSGAAAPVTAPIAAAAGVANLGLGVIQDIAHWTGLANNPGTIGQMSALLDEYQRLTQNNKTGIQPDKVAKENYINAVQSGDPRKANQAFTSYESHLMHRYQENAMLTNDPAKKKQAADAFKLADRLAHHIYDAQQKNNFQPIPTPTTAPVDHPAAAKRPTVHGMN